VLAVLNPHAARTPEELRLAAEERLQQQQPGTGTSLPELLRLQHELQVHQIELEMQNEELQAANAEIEDVLERYTDLFDFAPVGYLNLNADGTINLVNLSCAQLLGLERDLMMKQRLSSFIPENERPAFTQFMQRVFLTGVRQTCELGVLVSGGTGRTVHLAALRAQDAKGCRAVLMDITERKRAEVKLREQLDELLRWQNAMLAREGRVQQMKAEVNALLTLQGQPARYPSQAS
jgi:PAS domain S-box-containing protein